MLVAVATIVGHSSMPHHHYIVIQTLDQHDEEGANPHHHEQEQDIKDHHSIFSFAQLDEDFLPSQFSKVGIDLPILYLLTPVITYHFNKSKERSKTHFGYYREFPPPDHYSSNLFSRPPPVTLAV
jgi:hypothetical protein